MTALLGREFLVVVGFPFSYLLSILCHSLLACGVSAEKLADKSYRTSFYVSFSLAAFNTLLTRDILQPQVLVSTKILQSVRG